MILKLKTMILALTFAGSLAMLGAILMMPAPAYAQQCVAVCDSGPCLCPSNQQCVIWVAPGGGPCIGPGGHCNDTCIGPQ